MRSASVLVLAASLSAGCSGDPVSPYTSGTDTDTDGDSDADAGDPLERCDPSAANWPPAWAALEDQVVDLVNAIREEGADCGDAGVFAATAPLVMEPHLQCAARVHSLDMGTRNYFDHNSGPDGPLGDTPFERVAAAEYEGFLLGENLAAGEDNAEDTVEMWIGSGQHCAKMMNPGATETGIGFAAVDGSVWTNYWTQDFGSP